MKSFVSILFAALLAFLCSACTEASLHLQAQTANAVAYAANAALPILVERYRQEGLDAIAKAPTRDEAERAIDAVRLKWQPVWKQWETLRIAEDAWAKAIEERGDLMSALRALGDAYCSLLVVWPEDVPVVPLAPLRCAKEAIP